MSHLKRVLHLRTVVSTSAGLAFAAINFLALTQVAAGLAGDTAWLAILLAGAVTLLAAATFSELNARLPSAAGIRLWTKRGLTDRFSLFFTLLYTTTILAVIAADSFVLGMVMRAAVPAVPAFLWIVLFLTLSWWANLRGVKMAGLLEDYTTFALLGSVIIVALVGLSHGGFHLHHPLAVGAVAGQLPMAVAVGIFVFVGFEWVTPLAEEVTDSRMMTPGMFVSLGAIALAFGLFILAMTNLLPPKVWQHSVIPQLLVGQAAMGQVGYWWMFAVTAVTAITTFNGAFVSASRLLYALAREHSLPPSLGRLNQRFVPNVALTALLLISLGLAAIIFLTRWYNLLIDAGAALESAMYAVAALALIGLRRKHPAPPGFRVPGGSVLLILTAVIFGFLSISSALQAGGLPHPQVPWTLIFLVAMAGLTLLYLHYLLPRFRPKERVRRRPGASLPPGEGGS